MSWGVSAAPRSMSGAPARPKDAGHPAPAVGPRCLMTFSSPSGSARVTVAVHGEVDWDARSVFYDNLMGALDASEQGADLHLGDVTFWDGSALNALLAARQHAAAVNKTLTLRAASPIVRRVLELTDTADLFTDGTET
jgi:anti-anti-sigma factor